MNARIELVIKVADRLTVALFFLKLLKLMPGVSWWLVFTPFWLLALWAASDFLARLITPRDEISTA
jgi:hypothetical protein